MDDEIESLSDMELNLYSFSYLSLSLVPRLRDDEKDKNKRKTCLDTEEQPGRIFDGLFHFHEERHRFFAVDEAMI